MKTLHDLECTPIQLKVPLKWYEMFEKINSAGINPNRKLNTMLMYFEMGYLLHIFYDRVNDKIKKQSKDINELHEKEFQKQANKLIRQVLIPVTNPIPSFDFRICKTFSEKYNLINDLVSSSLSDWRTFSAPKIIKDYLNTRSQELKTSVSNLALNCICSGAASLNFSIYLMFNKNEYLNVRKRFEDIFDSRLVDIKIHNGRYYPIIDKIS